MNPFKISILKYSIGLIFILLFLTTEILLSKTSLKASLETGFSDIEFFGEGISNHFLLKLIGNKKYELSELDYKLNSDAGYYNVNEVLHTLKFSGYVNYSILFNRTVFSFILSGSNNLNKVEGNDSQSLNHILTRVSVLYWMHKQTAIEVAGQNSFNRLNFNEKGYMNIYNYSTSILIVDVFGFNTKSGLFMDDITSGEKDINLNKKRFGIQIDLDYRKKIIFSFNLRASRFYNTDISHLHFNMVAGKYVGSKLSLFVNGNIVRLNGNTKDITKLFLLNPPEHYNSATTKLGYDLSRSIHLYLKYLYENQIIVDVNRFIDSQQYLVGLQYKIL